MNAASCYRPVDVLLTYDCEIDKDRKHRMLQFFRFFARVELDMGIFETAE